MRGAAAATSSSESSVIGVIHHLSVDLEETDVELRSREGVDAAEHDPAAGDRFEAGVWRTGEVRSS